MTRGRAWIGVLGVLLVGIVALNVVTLSFATSSGQIDEQITALDKENSMLRSRDAQRSSTARVRHDAAAAGLAMPTSKTRWRSRPARTTSPPPPPAWPPPGRARTRADAVDRAPDRAPLRRLPPLLRSFVGRAFWLQGVQGAQLASEAAYQQTEVVTVPGLRGSLLDRHGNELAASEDAATIYATPYQVKNPPQAAEKLAPILDQSKAEVLSALTEESGFSYVAQKVDLETAARIEALELEGIGQLPDSRRTYPQGDMAGQVIGAVGSENQGLTGLEVGEETSCTGPTASGGSSTTRSATRSGWKRSRRPATAKTSSSPSTR